MINNMLKNKNVVGVNKLMNVKSMATGIVKPPIQKKAPLIKPQGVVKPNIVKPIINKKPVNKEETPITEEVKEQIVEEVKDNVVEIEHVEEAIKTEDTVIENEITEEEVSTKDNTNDIVEQTIEQTIEEKEQIEEPVIVEEKKKTTRTKKKKETEEVINNDIEESLNSKQIVHNYEETVSKLIMYSLDDEWEKECKLIDEQVKSISIDHDMNPTLLLQAMSDLSSLRDAVYYNHCRYKTIMDMTELKINTVKQLNSLGSSADERKMNALKACLRHKEGDYYYDLMELHAINTIRYNFYESVMKQIEFKRQALIIMNGGLKLEKDLM